MISPILKQKKIRPGLVWCHVSDTCFALHCNYNTIVECWRGWKMGAGKAPTTLQANKLNVGFAYPQLQFLSAFPAHIN